MVRSHYHESQNYHPDCNEFFSGHVPVRHDKIIHDERTRSVQQEATGQELWQIIDWMQTEEEHDAARQAHKITDFAVLRVL